MPDIRPFHGVLYNAQKIENIAQVVTEPYDVISPAQQNAYYQSHPYNIIRLILGKQFPQDTNKVNQYTRAKEFLKDWLKRDVLQRDQRENIYIYTQTFPHKNRSRTRTGFIVLLKLEDFGKSTVLPHENTFSQPVQDRLKLMKAVGANLSPIFAMFIDPRRRVNKLLGQYKKEHRPYIVIKKGQVLHRIWRMGNKRKISTIQTLLKDRQIFIADGHHRYEAALNYKRQMQKKKKFVKGSSAFNYVMTYLVATADPGLAILPTHRVVRIKAKFKLQEVLQNLKKSFQVQSFSSSEQMFSCMYKGGSGRMFGVYFGKNRFYALRGNLQRDLDVAILHNIIIGRILSFVPFEESIYYTRDAQEAIKLVDEGKYQISFFLQPATVKQVQRVAKAGEKMPHKSTYFYPKLLTGLVVNKL